MFENHETHLKQSRCQRIGTALAVSGSLELVLALLGSSGRHSLHIQKSYKKANAILKVEVESSASQHINIMNVSAA